MGAGQPGALGCPGADLAGVHFAMDFLSQQNRRVDAGDGDGQSVDRRPPSDGHPSAQGKHVVVIGGGDTGSDCVGTAIRQGATDGHPVRNPAQAAGRQQPGDPLADLAEDHADLQLSHEEGCQRRWSVLTKELTGDRRPRGELHGSRSSGSAGPRAGK